MPRTRTPNGPREVTGRRRAAFTGMAATSSLLALSLSILWITSYFSSLHLGWPRHLSVDASTSSGSREVAVSNGVLRCYTDAHYPRDTYRYRAPASYSSPSASASVPPSDLRRFRISIEQSFYWLGFGFA